MKSNAYTYTATYNAFTYNVQIPYKCTNIEMSYFSRKDVADLLEKYCLALTMMYGREFEVAFFEDSEIYIRMKNPESTIPFDDEELNFVALFSINYLDLILYFRTDEYELDRIKLTTFQDLRKGLEKWIDKYSEKFCT